MIGIVTFSFFEADRRMAGRYPFNLSGGLRWMLGSAIRGNSNCGAFVNCGVSDALDARVYTD
jgi:hypothetical protein